ncbi:MAG: alginate O-acetyltransferase AlgF [Vulcanimicrobiaceae bacterium]
MTLRAIRRLIAGPVTLVLLGGLASAAAAQALTTLYGARPPAGSSYVRVVDPSTQPVTVAIGAAPATRLSAAGMIATTYRIEPGGRPVAIAIDGQSLTTSVVLPAGAFLTLIVRRGSDGPRLAAIADTVGDVDGLRAQLRFYNLAAGCRASVQTASGATVFAGIASGESIARTINPVTATLVPHCGATAGRSLRLPQLNAGDRYSIFLIGDAARPALVGNLDLTEPYKK